MTFIGHLCGICSMCETMVIWCLGFVSEALCAVSEALWSISDEHYTKSSNCLVSDEEKGRHTLTTCILHLKKGETLSKCASPIRGKGRRTLWGCVSILLTAQKEYQQDILHEILLAPTYEWPWAHVCLRSFDARTRSTAWRTSCLWFSKPLYCRGFKS
jgi:hypothetical protein